MNGADGGPAFPVTPVFAHDDSPGSPYCITESGMSLRDWFAGQALAGILANPARDGMLIDPPAAAYRVADAMLAARAPTPSEPNVQPPGGQP